MSDLSIEDILSKADFRAEQWVEKACAPIGDNRVGDDPRYEDEFNTIKYQLGNLKGTDFQVLLQASTSILFNKAKDLRVAGYATLSAARLYGVKGLASGLQVCCYLITEYGDNCHPIKEKQRNNILNWFSEQQKKFIRFIEDDIKTVSDEWVLALDEQLTNYQENFRLAIEPSLGSLKDIHKLVTKYASEVKQKQQAEATKQAQASQSSESATATEQNQAVTLTEQTSQSSSPSATAMTPTAANQSSAELPQLSSLQSETELNSAVREFIKFFREQKDYDRMVAMSRAMRWSSQPVPPNDSGTTRIPALRQSAFAELNNLAAKENWEQVFLKAEAIFMEGGAHLCFDLQQISCNAARKMGRQALAQMIEGQVALLLKKLPELVNLKYNDGAKFASPACMSWLESLQQQSSNDDNKASDRSKEIEAEANTLCQEKSLAEALTFISQQPKFNDLEAAEFKLLQAQLCLNHQREEIAFSILQQLAEQVSEFQLDRWAPEFAMNVWRYLERSMQAISGEQHDFTEQAQQLKRKMFQTNPSLAAQWF